jgi:hypothetical protein
MMTRDEAEEGQVTLPAEVITTDRSLEQAAERTTGQLARHRWHWTLDETNPGRVSIREYARQVGRGYGAIHQQATGYAEALIRHDESDAVKVQEHITRAGMGAESAAAAQAVAAARGTSLANAQRGRYADESRRVREIARQRAEDRGTTVEDEAPKVAEVIARHDDARRQEDADKAEHADIRFVEMEGYLARAKRELFRALKLAPAVPWDDESRELLADTVGNVKTLLALIDTALSGQASGIDWDAELAKLGDRP